MAQVDGSLTTVMLNCPSSYFIGYLSTTLSWQRYRLANPGTKLLEDLQEKPSVIIKEKIISLSYTVFLLLCLKQ